MLPTTTPGWRGGEDGTGEERREGNERANAASLLRSLREGTPLARKTAASPLASEMRDRSTDRRHDPLSADATMGGGEEGGREKMRGPRRDFPCSAIGSVHYSCVLLAHRPFLSLSLFLAVCLSRKRRGNDN